MAKRPDDRYTNLASVTVTMSAANTMTFVELLTGISIGQGMGMIIDQIDYFPYSTTLTQMTANSDQITMGWTTSNELTALALNDRRVLHMSEFSRHDFGTAASAQFIQMPGEHQFFPPLIIAAPRLYFGVNTAGFASAAVVASRLYFRYIELTSQEYLELAETFILVG